MKPLLIATACCLVFTGCRQDKPATVAVPEKAAGGLLGTRVSISLNRSVLGLSLEKPISREAGTINGVETSITGYVQKETEHFLVLSRRPARDQEKEHDESLLWIPYSSILTIRQQYPNSKGEREPIDQPGAWRLEAVQNFMELAGVDLTRIPEGYLDIWLERNGKKSLLDGVDTHPGHEQWLYIGIAPYKRDALMISVVSDESPGTSMTFIPLDEPKAFQNMIKGTPDWTKPVLIAAENHGASPGKIYAQLTPEK
ncbi:hypothetical protein JIN84_08270 [Luteolibacter yonseiensis]|uniref:Lipoprotein n=1 Tax=Luteolibacter yonseiensis TaxID=1144680 RepID=A0A934R2H6_9BACT|nr:hypothetical protein [Luteolibacter yonseiensis]MBK1815607.1 hypothetical protein [Luteolibacter yonseiensis]